MAQAQARSPQRASPLPEGKWLDVDGIRTRYFDVGSGEPVVFIYGGNFGTGDSASSAYTWSKNLVPLGEHFRAVTFDKVGQGETDNPKNDDYTMAAVVRHAAAFIRAMKLPPVHLVGHSRGGYAATRVTLEHHDLVKSLTVVNSGTLSPGIGTNEVVLAKPPYPAGTRECVRWVYQNYSFNPGIVDDEWVDAVMSTLSLPKYQESVRKLTVEKLNSKLFLPELAREKRETLQWINEGRLQRPVQVIWGFDDRTAVIDRGIELYNMFAKHERRALFHVINQSGHFPFREHPERFNALMRRWVEAVK
jgi:2-hydroxy-6-oxonona-2,4-dienedioate hydrolase